MAAGLECCYYRSSSLLQVEHNWMSPYRAHSRDLMLKDNITSSWRFLRSDVSMIYGHLLRKATYNLALWTSALKCVCTPRVPIYVNRCAPLCLVCACVTFHSFRDESYQPAAGTPKLASPRVPFRRTHTLHDQAARCGLMNEEIRRRETRKR